MTNVPEPFWGGQDPAAYANAVLEGYGIDDNPTGKHFQLIVHDPNDPCLIRGIIGSVQIGAEGWVEILFAPPMHITVYLEKYSLVLRGVIGINGQWGLQFSELKTPFGEISHMDDIFPDPPAIEFTVLL